MLGVVVLSILAQLCPQLVAEQLPVEGLNVAGLKIGVWMCILLEYSGVVHFSYVFKWIVIRFFCCSYRKTKKLRKNEMTLSDMDFKAMADLMKSWSDDEGGIDVERDDEDTDEEAPPVSPEEIQMLKWKSNFPLTSEVDNMNEKTIQKMTKHAEDNPEEFKKFPVIIGDRAYPSTGMIAASLERKGIQVPPFLLPISSPDHVPPHITCCQLIVDNIQLKKATAARRNKKAKKSGKSRSSRKKKIVESSSSSESESSSEEESSSAPGEESSDYVTSGSSSVSGSEESS